MLGALTTNPSTFVHYNCRKCVHKFTGKKGRRQVNKKFFEFKNVEYGDDIKIKETRQGGLCACDAVR